MPTKTMTLLLGLVGGIGIAWAVQTAGRIGLENISNREFAGRRGENRHFVRFRNEDFEDESDGFVGENRAWRRVADIDDEFDFRNDDAYAMAPGDFRRRGIDRNERGRGRNGDRRPAGNDRFSSRR